MTQPLLWWQKDPGEKDLKDVEFSFSYLLCSLSACVEPWLNLSLGTFMHSTQIQGFSGGGLFFYIYLKVSKMKDKNKPDHFVSTFANGFNQLVIKH